MDFRGTLDRVRRHLDGLGVACTVTAGPPATARSLRVTEAALGVRLPDSLKEFYRSVGEPYIFFWESHREEPRQAWGSLIVPSLDGLAELSGSSGWRRSALYTPEQAEAYGFPHTDDPALARRTAARMWDWLPVLEDGDSDLFCLDLAAPGGPVVFHRHDWTDGGTGANGHPVAPDWGAFLAGWASVCFQRPAGLYWPRCFRPDGGVEWSGEPFRDPYRVAGPVGFKPS